MQAIEVTYAKHSDAISEALPHLITHSRSGLAGLLAAQRAVAAAGMQSCLRPRLLSEQSTDSNRLLSEVQ